MLACPYSKTTLQCMLCIVLTVTLPTCVTAGMLGTAHGQPYMCRHARPVDFAAVHHAYVHLVSDAKCWYVETHLHTL